MRRETKHTLALTVALLTFLGWLQHDPVTPAPLPAEPAVVVKRPSFERVRVLSSAPSPPPGSSTEQPYQAETDEQEALTAAAEASGMGIIRCPMEELSGPHELPFHAHLIEDGELLALVEESEGVRSVHPPEPPQMLQREDPELYHQERLRAAQPLGSWTWGAAHPGELGWCSWEESQPITLQGRVVYADGSPAAERLVYGCAPEPIPTDEQGRFAIDTFRGSPCLLTSGARGLPGLGLEVRRERDLDGLQVLYEDVDIRGQLLSSLEQLRRQEGQPDPLSIALEDPDLPDSARALLEDWRSQEQQRLDEQREAQELMAVMISNLQVLRP